MPLITRINDFDAGFICGLVAGEGSYRRPQTACAGHQTSSRRPRPAPVSSGEARWQNLRALLSRWPPLLFLAPNGEIASCFVAALSQTFCPSAVSEINL